jgi:hypothetical protein
VSYRTTPFTPAESRFPPIVGGSPIGSSANSRVRPRPPSAIPLTGHHRPPGAFGAAPSDDRAAPDPPRKREASTSSPAIATARPGCVHPPSTGRAVFGPAFGRPRRTARSLRPGGYRLLPPGQARRRAVHGTPAAQNGRYQTLDPVQTLITDILCTCPGGKLHLEGGGGAPSRPPCDHILFPPPPEWPDRPPPPRGHLSPRDCFLPRERCLPGRLRGRWRGIIAMCLARLRRTLSLAHARPCALGQRARLEARLRSSAVIRLDASPNTPPRPAEPDRATLRQGISRESRGGGRGG